MALIEKSRPAGQTKTPQAPDWQSLSLASPLLSALPAPVQRQTRLLHLAREAVLFSQGDRPKAMFFVLSGDVRLARRSHAGGEIILQRTRCGFLAEASLDQSGYHCDAVAAEASSLLAIPRKAFREALDEVSDFKDRWIAHLAQELRKVRTQAERLSLKTARERIVHFVETEGESGVVDLRQSKKDWAVELGLTHEALYRTLAQMEKCGELKVNKSRLTLR